MRFRVDGALPCGAVAGVASATAAVAEPSTPHLITPEARPIIVSTIASADRSILERFLADLALAPELAGELVALYVEQHPQLTLRFVAAATELDERAGASIAWAAHQRDVAGLHGLALVLFAALALVTGPAAELDTPPVILDIAPLEFDDTFPW